MELPKYTGCPLNVKLWAFLSVCLQVLEMCQGSATLELKLVTFRNDANKDSSGSCCDLACNPCDTTFLFCLDHFYSMYADFKDMSKCDIYRRQTGTYKDQKNVQFDHDANGIQNPITLKFQQWPGSIILKVLVWDVDTWNENDEVERGIQLVWSQRPSRTFGEAAYETSVLKGVTGKSLTVSVRSWCDQHWHGDSCGKFCQPQDDPTGHYTCHPDTGNRVCITGWEGEDCTIRADDCEQHRCANGATCTDGNRTYTCACALGFTGQHCEEDIDECLTQPCMAGGTCIDGRGSVTCVCPHGHVGKFCEMEACADKDPCQHGGTCYGHRKCLCPDGFTGEFCETDQCEEIECSNGGTCQAGKCTCKEGFMGTTCDVNQCDIKECHNGGVCVAGHCDCAGTGYNGSACQVKVNYCETLPCNGRGECISLRLSYKCECYMGYKGKDCRGTVGNNVNVLDPSKAETPEVLASNDDSKEPANKQTIPIMYYIIAGVVVGVILIILLAAVLACAVRRKRKRRGNEEDPYSMPASDYTGSHNNPAYGSTPGSMDGTSMSSSMTPMDPYAQPTHGHDRHALSSPPSYDESEMAAAAVSILPEEPVKKDPLPDDSSDEDEPDADNGNPGERNDQR